MESPTSSSPKIRTSNSNLRPASKQSISRSSEPRIESSRLKKEEERRKIEAEIDDLISDSSDNDDAEKEQDTKSPASSRKAVADEDEEDSRAARQKAVSVPDSKESIFEVDEDGQANVAVFDSLEMRAAFLHYCRSPILAHEMQMAPVIPQMSAQQFTTMARDMKLIEPEGPLSLISLGLTYTTLKEDEDRGLSFSGFLDSLLELAFDCELNVAARLVTTYHEQSLKARLHVRETSIRASDSGSRSILAGPPSLISRGVPRFSEASPAGRMARMSEMNNGPMTSLAAPISFGGGSLLDRPTPAGGSSLLDRMKSQLNSSQESSSAPGSFVGLDNVVALDTGSRAAGSENDSERKLSSWNTTLGRFSLSGTPELTSERSSSNYDQNGDRRTPSFMMSMKRGSSGGERSSAGGLTPTMALPRNTVKNILRSSKELDETSEDKAEEEDESNHPLHRAAAIPSSPARPMSRMKVSPSTFSRVSSNEGGDRDRASWPFSGSIVTGPGLQGSKSSYFAERSSAQKEDDDDDWGPTPNYTAQDLKADVLDPKKAKPSLQVKKEVSEPASVYGASPSINGRRKLAVSTLAPNSRDLAAGLYSPTPPPPKLTRSPSTSGATSDLSSMRKRESISKAEQFAASSPYVVSPSAPAPQPPKDKRLSGLKEKEPPRSARRQIEASKPK